MLKIPSTQRLTNIIVAMLLLVTPLIFVTNTKELFEFPKMIFVYILGSTLIFLFTLSKIQNPKKLILPHKWTLLFLVANIIATLFSTHRYTSIWGYYSRFNGGLISTFILFGTYLVIKNTKNVATNFLEYATILAVLPISLWGIYQHFQGITRVHSTFGQPNWLAAYLGMTLPLTLYKLLNPKNTYTKNLGLAGLYLLGFATLWFTYSLSGILGFTLGVTFLAYINKKAVKEKKGVCTAILCISLLIAASNLGIFRQRVEDTVTDVKNFISQRTQVYAQEDTYNLSDPGFIRSGMWRGTLNLIFANPKNLLFGTGPETFPYEFQKHRPAALNYSSEWEFILNKPHNYYLELLAELGLFGFVPYVLILYWTIKQKHPYITPSLLAFYTTNIFSWPVVSTALLFWIYLALLEKKI